MKPRSKLAPDSRAVRSITTGLSQGRLLGASRSSHCVAANATRAVSLGRMPRTSRVASDHHSSMARKLCCQKTNGGSRQAGSAKRRSRVRGAKGSSSPFDKAKCASRAASIAAAIASSSWRPGARARCDAQSNHASASAWGETPCVNRAVMARATRSKVAKDGRDRLSAAPVAVGGGGREAPLLDMAMSYAEASDAVLI